MPRRTPYNQLSDIGRQFVDSLITAYYDKVGWPDQMSKAEARVGMIELLDGGFVEINRSHEDPLHPDCTWSMMIKSSDDTGRSVFDVIKPN